MINNEILSFIKDQIAEGTTKDQVKDMLVKQGGWDEKDVEEAFETINISGVSYPSALKNAMTDMVKSVDAIPSDDVAREVFSPGLSHVEQPKSMEPSVSNSFSFNPAFRTQTVSQPISSSRPDIDLRKEVSETESSHMDKTFSAGMFGELSEENGSAVKSKNPLLPPDVVAPGSVSPVMPFMRGVSGFSQQSSELLQDKTKKDSFSPLPSLNKMPASLSEVISGSSFTANRPQIEHQILPRLQMSSLSPHLQPSLSSPHVSTGGRFMLGLMMFLTGVAIGGMMMNAYMNGYISGAPLSGIVESGMDIIGLGAVPVTKTTGGLQ